MSYDNSESDTTIMKLKGKLMYARVFQPDTTYGEKWTLDLLLDEENLKKAKEATLRIKKLKKDGTPKYAGLYEGFDGSYLSITRDCKEGRERPVVKDVRRANVDPNTMIGNGTDAAVQFMVKTMDKTGKHMSPARAMKELGGYGMFLTGVQIINLIEYKRSEDPDRDFVDEEGSFNTTKGTGFDFDEGDSLDVFEN